MRWLLVSLLVFPAIAAADAIGPPPTRCPEGSEGVFCHGPDTCAVDGCVGDGDCETGEVCRQRALCVEDHCCGGRCCVIPSCEPTPTEHAIGACSAAGTCGRGGTCVTRSVCVPAATDVDAGRIDAGRTDAGAIDAGREDAGRTDAGRSDAGRADAGRTDAGRSDAGRADRTDAGHFDGGRGEDAGTSGAMDGGCCSSVGAKNELGGALFLALVIAVVLRFARKRKS